MNLLHNEKIISISNGDKLTLTTHRVRFEYSSASLMAIIIKALQGQGDEPAKRNRNFISIFLEQITSIEYRYRSFRIFAILALLSVLGAIYLFKENPDRNSGQAIAALLLALIFIILYYLTRKHIIQINTAKGTADFDLVVTHRDIVTQIIDQIDQAKNNRVLYLHKLSDTDYVATPLTPLNSSLQNACAHCGTVNDLDDSFCMSCGNRLK